MPKRTNTFQRLVTLIHERLNSGWKVTESKLFQDSITGEQREVDIAIEAMAFGSHLIISIECRDHKRPADVTWLESMAKKHESLPTSKLVLWSSSGFTKSALSKAKSFNIDTVSQNNVDSFDWVHLARKLIGGKVKCVTPLFEPFIDYDKADGRKMRIDQPMNHIISEENGEKKFSILQLLQLISANPNTRTVLLDHAPEGSGDFWIHYDPGFPCTIEDTDGEICKVFRIGIGIKTETETASVETRSANFQGSVLTLSSAALTKGTLEVLIEEQPNSLPTTIGKLIPKNSKIV